MNTLKKILLVEDDPAIRGIIAAFLTPDEYQITEADNAADAILKLSADEPFDLAILDFWLRNDHAVSIMDAITSSECRTPIIIISGGNRIMDLEVTEAISDVSGAVLFLQKPFRKAVLLEAVSSALRS